MEDVSALYAYIEAVVLRLAQVALTGLEGVTKNRKRLVFYFKLSSYVGEVSKCENVIFDEMRIQN